MDRYPDWPNLPAMMLACARAWGPRPLFRHWDGTAWRTTTWAGFAAATANLARALQSHGIAAGDRVVIVSPNRPEVAIAEVALMAIRAIPVPTYVTNTVADHAHVIADCGASAAIAADAAIAAALRQAAPGLETLIAMDAAEACLAFADLSSGTADPALLAAEAELIPREAIACLIYTSGTGGAPRGVMLPHRAILSNCAGAWDRLRALRLRHETYLSFLPASHSYEHLVGLFFLPSIGSEIVFSRGFEHLAKEFTEIAPSIITVVPRLLEIMRARILAQAARLSPWRRALFNQALAIGLRRQDGTLTAWDRLRDPILDRLVRAKIRARFGARFRAAVSGGARLEPEVGRFFLALGVLILQGYGQTEAGPAIAVNGPTSPRAETVGPPLPGLQVRIAEGGEILVGGDCVMTGYWGRPAETAAVLQDGWLRTGDVGHIDPDGHLVITDRKRDIIKLSGGDTLSPARIEGLLMAEPEIAQAVVGGDGEAALFAYVVAAEGQAEAALAAAIARVNQRLSQPERIRHHRCVPAFTQDNGLLTASQKIRRGAVLRLYAPFTPP